MANTDDAVMDAVLGRIAVPERIEPDPSHWGLGAVGVHGGLTLALLVRAIRQSAEAREFAGIDAAFLKPLRSGFDVTVQRIQSGRSVEFWRACAVVDGQPAVTAEAVLGTGHAHHEPIVPDPPPAPPPDECAVFRLPAKLVPISARTEVRPVGSARPFAGGSEAELVAWLRLVDDDEPPDVARFAMLMDALAPSYAAILRVPVPIPTVTLSVSPVAILPAGDSPWVLLRARTVASSRAGWIDEHLDAWTPSGAYLGHGHQRRLVVDRP